MSVLTVRFHSEALGKRTSFNVIHPDKGEGPFPVLMQLHGYSDDSFSWLYNSNIVRHVADLPLIVVLPDGGTSRYVNIAPHERFNLQRYEDLLVTDIPAELARTFQVRPGPWAIGGLSMGGQGALRIGMKHSDRFASIWAHSSGGLHPDPAWLALLDDPEDASSFVQAERLKSRVDAGATPPTIGFDCGADDFTIDGNRDLHAHMERIGLPHTYKEHAGAHTWEYWDEHVQEALIQHAAVLGITAVTD
ncbi:MAG TPA: alpha/beta hydrolase-fold protein [Thermomicrobiales bacterium]|nr:alpha/beta hydrolase-fold protein [Thermomicrobiales bacterium]